MTAFASRPSSVLLFETRPACMPTRHSSRRSPRRLVLGGRPGVRISVRQVMLCALRFGITCAFSSNAFWLRSSVKVLSGATGTAKSTVVPITSMAILRMSVSGRRGSSLKRSVASGELARCLSNRSMPEIICR